MHDENLATFVDVIVPLPLANLFTYRVPQELKDEVIPGKRVVVQFGKKKLYAAIAYRLHATPPKAYEAKYILSVIDDEPLIDETQMAFWNWISQYYMCTMGEVMQAALPLPFKLESESLLVLNTETDLSEIVLSDKEHLVVEALSLQPEIKIAEMADILQVKNVFPVLKSLHLKNVILFVEDLADSYTPKTEKCIELTEAYQDEANLENLFESLAKKEKQTNSLLAFLVLKQQQSKPISRKQLLQAQGASISAIQTLIKNGVFELFDIQIDRIQDEYTEHETFELSEEQEQATAAIKQNFLQHSVCLLHGVTSSGKTHVYVELMQEQIKQGKQVLLLLPEIALTSHMVRRVKKYFGSQAVAFHSKFSQNERVELWQKIKNGDVKVIIGARSSVFLPFQQLGLVIVDEEHDSSYKQNDPAPRYHARDAVIYLSQIHQCHTLLGSATPAFETYHNCKNGKFGLVQLDGRYGKLEHPILSLANIAEDKRVKLNKGNFTAALFAAISEALENKEQVILFQNRRGYAPVLECNTCGWAPRCIHCDISLTYHKYHEQLRCHYCGYSIALIKQCAACAGTDLSLKGLGTERIEDEINQHFPLAKVLRLDQDAAKTKKGHDKIIHAFGSHEADILVGTQMLSKGLDFEKVSLVGVINADQLLNFPDFRAHERAYQLLTQVSGRAGRKNKRGLVIIQTSAPNHPTIQKVVHQAFYNLYEEELQSRLTFHYPPFTRLIKLTIKHKDYKTAAMAASQLKNLLLPVFKEHLIGPESPHVSKIRNWYLKEILLKISKSDHSLSDKKNFIRKSITALQSDKSLKGIIFQTDVDPY